MKINKDEINIHSSAAEYLTYVAAVGDSSDSLEMRYEEENIWLTQKMIAELYDVDVRTINEHIKNIYSDDELEESSTIRKFRIVQTEGTRQVNREVIHYNLQMIIAVGFKVNNERAVRFRKWSGQIVKDYTIQGWAMDKERLKKGICSLMNILSVNYKAFVKFDFQRENFIKKLLIYMLQPLIMIKMLKRLKSFFKQFKIKCIGQSIDIQQQNLL